MVTAQDGELGRTISYNVSSFTDVRDKTMEDIMVKMPGITVNTDGGVSFSYNNIGVNKVYIDGVDMLEGQYEMVINMKPEDVERVEIIENHEPIKVMRGAQYSQDAAINIVLNDSARSNWGGTAKVGMGGSSYRIRPRNVLLSIYYKF
ncbi:MAG: Plug domain-containing protein [Tidjanibacter sp.]|nr:Plug domain-containing protein [Tidjanibacter sp.]